MTLPGYEVDLIESPPSFTTITDSAVLFAIGRGTNAVSLEEIYAMDQFIDVIGTRNDGALLYDGIDEFLHEGGYKAYVSSAIPGADAAGVTALLDNFQKGLGIGQLAAPGLTTQSIQRAVAAAAKDVGRVAILDGLDTASPTDLVAQAATITGQPGDRMSALFAPWDIIPGPAGGQSRTVPPSGRICGNLARNDSIGMSAGDPAAGPHGVAIYAYDLSRYYTDSQHQTLNEGSVCVSRIIRNRPRTMGWRSLADQTNDSNWSMFNGSRIYMVVYYDLGLVAETFEFAKADGRDHTLRKFQAAIKGALLPFYENDDFFGNSPDEAFTVDVGPSVNTTATLEEGLIKARVAFRAAPFGERIVIDVAKVPITQSLGLPVAA